MSENPDFREFGILEIWKAGFLDFREIRTFGNRTSEIPKNPKIQKNLKLQGNINTVLFQDQTFLVNVFTGPFLLPLQPYW